jgi:hypothetical protein
MDYDLTRLGSREFEHLTQALAMQVLGPGVQVFGDGPDGGREAEFRGQMRFPQPHPTGPWNGYGVLQAKFLQRPRGTTRDSAWLLGTLRSELRQWANKESKRCRAGATPDYLLFATNVVLSADPEVGGIDLFERTAMELIAELRLPIKEVKVWHFDQICRYLDQYPGLRQTYGGLTTAGDVLSRLRDFLDGTAAELGELLANHSSKELATDQWVRLGQAGEADNQRLPLAELAIDPAASYVTVNGVREDVALVRHILAHGDTVLRPTRKGNAPSHIAVIGGPGQGKSTTGQILCQVYRVALLRDAASRLTAETNDIVTTFVGEMQRIGLQVPAARRWPVRVNLSEYADAVAGGEVVSILRFMATQISRRTPDVTPNQLRAWLRAWPWFVVLDGLDEVASAQARDAVMERVTDFLQEAASVDADLLIVATSRPQGYREEFASRNFVHMRLESMAAGEAVNYATQLTRIRHQGDHETAERVLKRLEEASKDELTSRLMGTPLQVTIMAILLERRARVPQQRYRLFSDYYQTIYNREAGKPGALAKLIDEHRAAIAHLHERVGLFLQALSELTGESDAALHRSHVTEIVEAYLQGEGYSRGDAVALTERIVDAAMRRLILLVPSREDSVGFDVRSLQEFMAARAILSENLDDTCAFLTAISGSAHWRNTWLLSAGCIFHERPAVRDRLVNLLDDIQVVDELSLFTKPGSRLAVEMISDDVAAKAPRFLRALTKQAVELLEDPNEEFEAAALARALWDVAQDGPSRQVIERAIAKNVAAGGYGEVHTLLTLGVEWEDKSGPLAYRVRDFVLSERMKKDDLAAQLASGLIWPARLIDELNAGKLKTADDRSVWEVMRPYVERFGRQAEIEACRRIFDGDKLGFLLAPNGREVAVRYEHAGRHQIHDRRRDARWIQCLISVAEEVPIELWSVRYQISQVLISYLERIPVDFSAIAGVSHFGDLVRLLERRERNKYVSSSAE